MTQEQLEGLVYRMATIYATHKFYSEDEARDEKGEWSSGEMDSASKGLDSANAKLTEEGKKLDKAIKTHRKVLNSPFTKKEDVAASKAKLEERIKSHQEAINQHKAATDRIKSIIKR
jgi:hypothetical protein